MSSRKKRVTGRLNSPIGLLKAVNNKLIASKRVKKAGDDVAYGLLALNKALSKKRRKK